MSNFPPNANGQATSANSQPVVLASDQSTVPVSVSSLPLPTGAATAAKQPTLGTAGTASTDVLTVQGIASMVALKVDGSAVTQPVSVASLPLPTGASTSALQTTGNTSVASIDTKTPALGQALAAASVPIVLTAAQLITLTPVSTVTANAGTNLNTSALALETGGNLATIATRTPTLGQALAAASVPVILPSATITTLTPPAAITGFALETGGNLATIATRTPALGQALAAASVPVILPSATITTLTPPAAITGFALDATLTGGSQQSKLTDGTHLGTIKAASTAAATTDTALVVAISPNNTVPVSLTSTTVTGTVAVSIATNTPVIAAGTNTIGSVKLTDGTNTGTVKASSTAASATDTAVVVAISPNNTIATASTPISTGGLSTFHLASAASTNATNIKSSGGNLYGYMISNTSAAYSYVAFHNSGTAPTAGASIFFKIGIPAGGAANVEFSNGVNFSAGIGITTVTGAPDSNSTGVALSDLVINVFYK